MYYKKGLAKVELAVARGKKQEDRREDIKKRSADREMEQALKKTRR
jgi:SsrA-binding protein